MGGSFWSLATTILHAPCARASHERWTLDPSEPANLPGAPLCDQLTDHRDQLDRHLHDGVGGRLISGLIFGDRFLIRLRLVVLQNATHALRIPAVGEFRLLHDFLLRRRRSALNALAPSGYAVMTRDPSRPGRSSKGRRKTSSTSRSSTPC